MFGSSRRNSQSSIATGSSKLSKKDIKAMQAAKERQSGRPGHLDPGQEHKLKQFRAKIEEAGIFNPERHDDACLCRFLRARKWDVEAALTMFKDAEKWRKEFKVDELYENFDYPEKEKVDEIYPQFYHKQDKDGRPVYIEQLGKLDLRKLYEVTTPERQLQKLVVEYEKFQRERLPVCTAQKGELVETSCTIMDLKNVGLSQFWKVSGYVQEASKIGQYYYPETMGKLYIVHPPWLFNTVWNVIKGYLDPVTVDKIHILSDDKQLLEQIPDVDLPTIVGGKCDCADKGGCMSSDAGPWNTPDGKEIIEKVKQEGGEKREKHEAGATNGK
ncbi:putative SEC14-phosphatidylinositol/phosphatidylcholine transfer protein [Jaminaea rosea]|uniref:Putative SEC14-phosphatidylinositol/phosphatidylcholine transfer protein n=1 Tax=Jaminaea rosea TaxID=1569628 RepID=A0A316UMV1_9BASI|nr:putative SEC14-phosphatidylinositol/phosphatidylcholine transfer protein [Jaminaea rosea]PWN26589.1 putative SEC14-phosphatidylinositol/phosphatidylcholine transfer protein [Jaminaea rosea]